MCGQWSDSVENIVYFLMRKRRCRKGSIGNGKATFLTSINYSYFTTYLFFPSDLIAFLMYYCISARYLVCVDLG